MSVLCSLTYLIIALFHRLFSSGLLWLVCFFCYFWVFFCFVSFFCYWCCFFFFFFFSSRRRHTRLTCDWSSDVCSSDLARSARGARPAAGALSVGRLWRRRRERQDRAARARGARHHRRIMDVRTARSEERRVGKECRSRWSADHSKKNEERAASARGTGR